MEKRSLFKSKKQMIIYNIIAVICLSLFVIISRTPFNDNGQSEALKFSNIYNSVSDDNIYVFSNATDVLNVINGRSGVILFGFPENKWTNMYASILNDVCKSLNIDKIYYYDFHKDRKESNATYETIVKKLEMYTPMNDEGIQDLMAPTVVIIKNGKVIRYFDDLNITKGNISPEIYFNQDTRLLIYQNFRNALIEYINKE